MNGYVREGIRAEFSRCADAIDIADGLLITAGAGMGVDSGLPDFRGPEGFWRAYPALREAGIAFSTIASPSAFRDNPRLAWGFYGHRLKLYRETVPHEGFPILQDLARDLAHGAFIFTSNVDGQFQKAGFSSRRVAECHGSIHHLQCLGGCHPGIWPADDFPPDVDDERCLLLNEPPQCPRCGGIARPNILMFNDGEWLEERSSEQEARLERWLDSVNRLVIIEIGAGTAILSSLFHRVSTGLSDPRQSKRARITHSRARRQPSDAGAGCTSQNCRARCRPLPLVALT